MNGAGEMLSSRRRYLKTSRPARTWPALEQELTSVVRRAAEHRWPFACTPPRRVDQPIPHVFEAVTGSCRSTVWRWFSTTPRQ